MTTRGAWLYFHTGYSLPSNKHTFVLEHIGSAGSFFFFLSFAQIIFPAAEGEHDTMVNTCAQGTACFKAWLGVTNIPRGG